MYIVNLRDSSYLKIAEATDTSYTSAVNVRWQWVWIDPSPGFSEDPLWLDVSSEVRHGCRRDSGTKGNIRLAGDILSSSSALESVAIYTLRGERVYYREIGGRKSLRLAFSAGAGTHIVRVTSASGSELSFVRTPLRNKSE